LFAQKNQILHDQNKVIRDKFTVQPKDILEINTGYTNIVIEEWDKSEIVFITTVTLNNSTEEDMNNLWNAIQLSAKQKGKTVNYSLDVTWSGNAKTNNLHGFTEITLKITAPKDIYYDLKAKYGNVEMGSIKNDFNAKISYGTLKAIDMFGNKNNIQIGYGSLTMDDLHGAENQVTISYGNFRIFKAEQLSMELVYSNGEINFVDFLNLNSKYCDLKLGTVKFLSFSSGYDKITIQNQINKLNGEMKYGTLTINSLTTSCALPSFLHSNVTIKKVLRSFTDIHISAMYGNINLNITKDQSFAFNFSGRYTDIKDKNIKITNGVYFKGKPWNVDDGYFDYKTRTFDLKGNYGTNPNSGKSVKIEARYGSVSLFER